MGPGWGLWDPNNTTAKKVDLFIYSYYAGDSEGGGGGCRAREEWRRHEYLIIQRVEDPRKMRPINKQKDQKQGRTQERIVWQRSGAMGEEEEWRRRRAAECEKEERSNV